jgi:hypothetical protein
MHNFGIKRLDVTPALLKFAMIISNDLRLSKAFVNYLIIDGIYHLKYS